MTSEYLNNQVKEVKVSESSRRDARGGKDALSLKQAIDDCDKERLIHVERMAQIGHRLAVLRSKIAGGRTLPPSDYRRLCDEQAQLRIEKLELEQQQTPLMAKLRNLKDDLRRQDENPFHQSLDEMNELLRAILGELRLIRSKP